MSTPLLSSKLHIPAVRPELVSRPRLIERLNAGIDGKLTLVSAPPGYGKTTLAGTWAQQTNRSVAWLSLDEGDNDFGRFLTYLVAALQGIDKGIGATTPEAPQPDSPAQVEPLLTVLLSKISAAMTEASTMAARGFILVLDDYHVITAPSIHNALKFLLDYQLPQMHLVVISRADPPLSLSRLRVQGQITEIRLEDLKFTRHEASTFLNDLMGLTLAPGDTVALETRTEGWVAGLQLAALSLHGLSPAEKHDFVVAFTGDDRYIVDYLLDEVLHRQPAHIQDFLLRTAILERLSGSLCDSVRFGQAGSVRPDSAPTSQPLGPASGFEGSAAGGHIPSQTQLQYLEQNNLFVVPLDNKRQWYRYHHLFAELLRYRLKEQYPDKVAGLHLRASGWYQSNGLEKEAVRHVLAAADFPQAADLIEQLTQTTLFVEGRLFTVDRWLQALPGKVLRSRHRLGLYQAWVLMWTDRPEAAKAHLLDIEAAIGRDTDGAIAGEIATLRAYLAYYRGEFSRSAEYAQIALRLLPEDVPLLRTLVTSLQGDVLRLSGDVASARRVYTEIGQESPEGEHLATSLFALGCLIRLEVVRGNLHQAARGFRHARQMADGWLSNLDSPIPTLGIALVGMGELLCEWNDLAPAARHLEEGIALCRRWPGLTEFATEGTLSLARVFQAQGDTDLAHSLIREAELHTRQHGMSQWSLAWLAACHARLWLSGSEPDLAAAAGWAQRSGLSPDDTPRYLQEFEYLTLVRALLAEHRLDEALNLLVSMERAAKDAGRIKSVLECRVLQVLVLQAKGKTKRALLSLRETLSLAGPQASLRVFLDEGNPMARLLAELKTENIRANPFLEELLAAFGEVDIHSRHPSPQPLIDPLTEREHEVLRLLDTDLSGPEMAGELVVSVNTVRTHIKRIYGKLDAHSRHEAVMRARELGLL